MKQRENENAAPRCAAVKSETEIICKVRKRRTAAIVAGMLLLAAAVTAGYHTAPEELRLPVLLSSGEVIMQPCYVAVEGECVAIVKNRETAEAVVEQVEEQYTNQATTESEIEEKTTIEKMDLKNGDSKPEILTANEASRRIVKDEAITVKTKEVVEVDETVAYKIIEKKTDELNLGETRLEQQGEAGIRHVTKEVIKENGQVVDERVISQSVVKESIPEIMLYGTTGLAAPLDELRLTSGFGYRWGRQHEGVDLGMAEGSQIYAAKGGVVTCAAYTGSYGNLVKIDHGDGMETYYAHCSRLDVAAGQQVEAGQQIAAVGSTGNSTGPHLHFEVRVNGVSQDPAQWLAGL